MNYRYEGGVGRADPLAALTRSIVTGEDKTYGELTRNASMDLKEVHRGRVSVDRLDTQGMLVWLVGPQGDKLVVSVQNKGNTSMAIKAHANLNVRNDAFTAPADILRAIRDAETDYMANNIAFASRYDTPATTYMLRRGLESEYPYATSVTIAPGMELSWQPSTRDDAEFEIAPVNGMIFRMMITWELERSMSVPFEMKILILSEEMYAVEDMLRACVNSIASQKKMADFDRCAKCGKQLSREYEGALESLSSENMLIPIMTAGFSICTHCSLRATARIREQEEYLKEGAVPEF